MSWWGAPRYAPPGDPVHDTAEPDWMDRAARGLDRLLQPRAAIVLCLCVIATHGALVLLLGQGVILREFDQSLAESLRLAAGESTWDSPEPTFVPMATLLTAVMGAVCVLQSRAAARDDAERRSARHRRSGR